MKCRASVEADVKQPQISSPRHFLLLWYDMFLPAERTHCTLTYATPGALPWNFLPTQLRLLHTPACEVRLPLVDRMEAWASLRFLTRLSRELHAWAPVLLVVSRFDHG